MSNVFMHPFLEYIQKNTHKTQTKNVLGILKVCFAYKYEHV